MPGLVPGIHVFGPRVSPQGVDGIPNSGLPEFGRFELHKSRERDLW